MHSELKLLIFTATLCLLLLNLASYGQVNAVPHVFSVAMENEEHWRLILV